MTMTRIYTIADVNEEKSKKFSWRCPIAISRVLKCMFNMSIWFNEQFLLMVASEALIHAACLVPFMFIKGRYYYVRLNQRPDGQYSVKMVNILVYEF